jgi:flagellar basal body-associated protein FliL
LRFQKKKIDKNIKSARLKKKKKKMKPTLLLFVVLLLLLVSSSLLVAAGSNSITSTKNSNSQIHSEVLSGPSTVTNTFAQVGNVESFVYTALRGFLFTLPILLLAM